MRTAEPPRIQRSRRGCCDTAGRVLVLGRGVLKGRPRGYAGEAGLRPSSLRRHQPPHRAPVPHILLRVLPIGSIASHRTATGHRRRLARHVARAGQASPGSAGLRGQGVVGERGTTSAHQFGEPRAQATFRSQRSSQDVRQLRQQRIPISEQKVDYARSGDSVKVHCASCGKAMAWLGARQNRDI